ncbi:hypothetical protein ONE63_007842 [Megalurothrips usitatus]|uniref:Serpin domain-containing protein n=1 Tax=Megalurothrips usitatus TaxID=439358 RepID=A0AAV7XRF4_9NEOP|nr:hypothetical protein ONE63_007842 [Megalurothrips usitatus]
MRTTLAGKAWLHRGAGLGTKRFDVPGSFSERSPCVSGPAALALLSLWCSTCAGLPAAPYTTQVYKQATSPGAFIGEGINGIAAAMLHQDSDKQCNAAYSPLGYSAILAALAEGASGKTRSQMLSALKLPQDSSLTRATYRSVLGRMKEKNAVNKPEFRSWFYVYTKSVKLEDSYSAILRDHYLMSVRNIQEIEEDLPTDFFINKAPAPAAPEAEAAPATPAAPAAPAAPAIPEVPEAPPAAPVASEVPDVAADEKVPLVAEAPMTKPSEEKPKGEEPAAAAAALEDVPVVPDVADAIPAVVEEAAKPAAAAEVSPLDTAKVGEAATAGLGEDEAAAKPIDADQAALENKISLAKFEKKPTGDKKKDDKKKGRDAEDTNDRQPSSGPMLLSTFNALYYRGVWQVPFDAKFKDDFMVSEGKTKEVTTLRTQGTFRIGEIKELNATAVELPYKGESGRYSLLVLLPKAEDGIAKLTEALTKYSFRYLAKSMREKQVDVAIPEFEIDCISHPQAVFRKLGMTAMLDKENAEFPGISKNQRLYLQDDGMAQLVRFKVDDTNAVANYLSAMSMSTRSGLNVFHANRPFVFYLRDNLDNLTIVAGRVVDPTIRPEHGLPDATPEEEQEQEQEQEQIRRL